MRMEMRSYARDRELSGLTEADSRNAYITAVTTNAAHTDLWCIHSCTPATIALTSIIADETIRTSSASAVVRALATIGARQNPRPPKSSRQRRDLWTDQDRPTIHRYDT